MDRITANAVQKWKLIMYISIFTVILMNFAISANDTYLYRYLLQTATFCGQQGRISRTVRAILNGQPGISAGQRVLRPTDQY